MSSLLVKVKSKLSIYSHQKTRGLLEGEYGSVFKGRSMDFDDLREYIPGDDIKDIDWKATARAGQTLIKRYVAIRKHNILLAVDTGRNMSAASESGSSKKEITIMLAGVMGYIAQKHGDLVALVAGDATKTRYMPLKGNNQHLEAILQQIHTSIKRKSPESAFSTQLEYIAKNIRRRMIIVVITDDIVLTESMLQTIRRLRAQHEILWLTVSDINPSHAKWAKYTMHDIQSESSLPTFIKSHKALQAELEQSIEKATSHSHSALQRLGITSERITSEQEVVTKLFKLLEKQRYARN